MNKLHLRTICLEQLVPRGNANPMSLLWELDKRLCWENTARVEVVVNRWRLCKNFIKVALPRAFVLWRTCTTIESSVSWTWKSANLGFQEPSQKCWYWRWKRLWKLTRCQCNCHKEPEVGQSLMSLLSHPGDPESASVKFLKDCWNLKKN